MLQGLPSGNGTLLGYEGIFAADILLLNLEDAKNPIPLSMTIPIKEIWVTGGDPEKICREPLAGQQAHVRMIQGGSAKVDDMIFRTNGSSWLVSFDEAGVLFQEINCLRIQSIRLASSGWQGAENRQIL